MKKRFLLLFLCSILLLALTACADGKSGVTDLTKDYPPSTEQSGTEAELAAAAPVIRDLSLRLFANCAEEENALLSPVSVLTALAMTANGAAGETAAQMEGFFGADTETLNRAFSVLLAKTEETDSPLSIADSIWLKEDEAFRAEPDFLQKNADLYRASVFSAPFDAKSCQAINAWVKEKTQGMIPGILDEIPENAVMYLINAVAFEAKWQQPYKKGQIRDGLFHTADGEEETVSFLYSEENLYLDDGKARGFLKYYKDEGYAFLALLPNEDVPLADYVAGLDGASFARCLEEARRIKVNAALPKFENDYGTELSEMLAGMGMPDAFDPDRADFSALGSYRQGEENIYINRVLHKSYICVDEQGTKAAAVTAVENATESAEIEEESQTVILDRPFLYMILDTENDLPIFIGTVTKIDD